MICANIVTDGAGVQTLVIASPQPADLSTCPVVLSVGSETAGLSSLAFPTSADAGAAWAWGFSLVVVSYMFAWACGAVLNFLNER